MSSCCELRCAISCYDEQIFFRFILPFSWRASSFHCGTMKVIVLRWNAQFLHFLGFFLSFDILDLVLMLFPAFVGFPSYLGLSWSFYY
ncbi:hypothetical protein QL285_081820 [Trifolium repens]|nr:hypothetical protein QL285_081820 [Trifolium repens]